MSDWVWSAVIGVGFGALIFAVIFVPLVFLHYRRYGTWTWLRLLGAAAVSIYLAAVFSYTMLPLPDPGDYECVAGVQRVPLQFIDDIRSVVALRGRRAALTSFTVLQVAFNVVLFVPWGIIARRYFGWSFLLSVFTGFLASVFIEATQYTGLWFIYDCAYRVADVDDVILNTTGAFIGALIAPVVLWFMPQRRALRDHRFAPRPVTIWRRWLGMLADYFLVNILAGAFVVAAHVSLVVGNADSAVVPGWVGLLDVGAWLLAGLVVFILPSLSRVGASLGQRMVWLAPVSPEDSGRGRLVVRSLVSGGLYTVLQAMSLVEAGELGGGISGTLAGTVLLATFVAVGFTKDLRGLSGLVSGTRIVDARTVVSSDDVPERVTFRRDDS